MRCIENDLAGVVLGQQRAYRLSVRSRGRAKPPITEKMNSRIPVS